MDFDFLESQFLNGLWQMPIVDKIRVDEWPLFVIQYSICFQDYNFFVIWMWDFPNLGKSKIRSLDVHRAEFRFSYNHTSILWNCEVFWNLKIHHFVCYQCCTRISVQYLWINTEVMILFLIFSPFKLHVELELTDEQISPLVEGNAKFTTEVAAKDLPNNQRLTDMPN